LWSAGTKGVFMDKSAHPRVRFSPVFVHGSVRTQARKARDPSASSGASAGPKALLQGGDGYDPRIIKVARRRTTTPPPRGFAGDFRRPSRPSCTRERPVVGASVHEYRVARPGTPSSWSFSGARCLVFVLVNSRRAPKVHEYKNGPARIAKPQLDGPGTEGETYA
jgi:hypothetical protein